VTAEDLAAHVLGVAERNEGSIDAAARAIVETLDSDGLVRPAGAGHSLAAVVETFFRAGGLAAVRPLWDPRVLPLTSAADATRAEREAGLGTRAAERAGIEARDTVVVFSNSGTNPFPVEIARVAADRGATVIAVTSLAANSGAPRRADARLVDLAGIVIDTGVPAGDATWPPEAPVTAPISSLLTTTVWTLVLRRVHDLAPGAARWSSANVAGGDDLNRAHAVRYAARIPEL